MNAQSELAQHRDKVPPRRRQLRINAKCLRINGANTEVIPHWQPSPHTDTKEIYFSPGVFRFHPVMECHRCEVNIGWIPVTLRAHQFRGYNP